MSVFVRFVTLSPGDVFLTGTPPGVGVFRNPPVFLKVILVLQPCYPGGIPESGFSENLKLVNIYIHSFCRRIYPKRLSG